MSSETTAEISPAQIARLAGVGRAAVSNWRRRHADFPQPVGGTPANPTFALAEVEGWLTANGKLDAIPPGDRLWQQLRAYSEAWRLTETLADTAAFLSYLQSHKAGLGELAEQPDAIVAKRLPEAVAEHVRTVRMPGGQAFAGRLRPEQVGFWRTLAELAADQNPEAVFEDLHSRYLDSTARTTAATSLELAALVASMLPPVQEGVIFDPACGTGNLLRATFRKHGMEAGLAGQEIDPAMARIAAYRLSGDKTPVILAGDSLRDDQFVGYGGGEDGAAVVICDPPTAVRDWGHDELAYDPRWEFGLPPRSEPELAWLQHCYAHLRPGGRAIVVLPVAVASRRAGRRVRAEMLRRGALRRVVALPSGLASNHALGVHLWLLMRPSPGVIDEDDGEIIGAVEPARFVEMVDASRFGQDELRDVLSNWWHQFSDDTFSKDAAVTAKVPVINLLDEEVDLTPSRYLERPEAEVAADHARVVAELAPLLEGLAERLPARPSRRDTAQRDTARLDAPMVTIAELARQPGLAQPGAVAVFLAHEFSRLDVGGLKPGDVLVSVLDRSEPPVVVTDHPQWKQPTPDRHLIRCDPEVLDPYFLAGFLHSDANKRRAVTGSGVFRYDVRRARVPRLPIAEQRRYGQAFRRLLEFGADLRRATGLGEDAVRLAIDGLTSGLYEPSGPGESTELGEPSGLDEPATIQQTRGE